MGSFLHSTFRRLDRYCKKLSEHNIAELIAAKMLVAHYADRKKHAALNGPLSGPRKHASQDLFLFLTRVRITYSRIMPGSAF